jgi:diguanylate cyclase (GGDEF)-like protein
LKLGAAGHYHDLEVVRRDGDTMILRGSAADGSAVLVSTHTHPLPTDDTRRRFRREFDVATETTHPHLARARELIDEPSRVAIVFDDPGVTTLADRVAGADLDEVELLTVATDIGQALVAMHLAGVTHGAVDAEHIVVAAGRGMLMRLGDAEHEDALPVGDQAALAATVDAAAEASAIALSAPARAALDRAMAAEPSHRYRSVLGLVADLRAGDSPLGTADVSLAWRNPQRLIGRGALLDSIEALVNVAAAERIGRLVVVRGEEGSGRTALLGALCDRLAERGIFAGLGRFDPGGADPPLRAPIEAMSHIVAQVLAAPDATVAAIRTDLVDRLGGDAALAIQIIPALVHLIGQRPPPAIDAPQEAIARVGAAMIAAVGSIAAHAPAVALVFDDTDYADPTSTATIRLIGRRAEVGATVGVLATRYELPDALAATIDRVRGDGVGVDVIDVPPLGAADIAELLAEGTGSSAEDMHPLAVAIWLRSAGNVELAVSEIWSLVESGDLRVDIGLGRWTWSDKALAVTEPTTLDEVALLRFETLPDDARDVTTAAALAERSATIPVLAAATGLDPQVVAEHVSTAVAAHVLVHRSGIDSVDVLACVDGALRRAALAAVDPTRHNEIEARLARALLAEHPRPSDEMRFEIVRLMSTIETFADDRERAVFIALCSDSARAAHRSAGYQLALELQLRSITLLGTPGWTADQPEMFDLHLHAAEHALMVGDTSTVDRLVDAINDHDPTPEQRVQSLRVLSSRWWTRQDTDGGLDELRALLRELGEPIPESPTWADVGREFLATRLALVNVAPESLFAAPALTDSRIRAVTDTMLRCVHLAYISEPTTHIVLALRGTRLTVRHGLSDGSGYFLTAYAMLSCAFRTDVDRALRFGRVGMQLAAGVGGTTEAMVTFAYNSFVRHWGEPIGTTIEPMLQQYRRTLERRQRGYGLTSGTFAVLHSVLASQPLQSTDDLAAKCADDFERLGEHAFRTRVDIVRQLIADLRSGDAGDGLDGEYFDAGAWLATKPRRNELALIVHTLRGLEASCFDDRDGLRASVAAGARLVRTAPGQAIVALHRFHAALSAADDAVAATSRRDRLRHRARAETSLRWMRSWQPRCDANVGHRIALVEAVLAEAAGDGARAMERYERAVQLATAHDAIADLAVCAQRAAAFHDQTAGSLLVSHYATLAYDAWHAWGATGAAAALVNRYPNVLEAHSESATGPADSARAQAPGRRDEPASTADTLVEASLLIGQQLELHEFLGRMLEILARQANASRGFLVLQSPDGPRVEAAVHRDGDMLVVAPPTAGALDQHADLCVPALSYVLRTRETLAVVDPAADRRFRQDERLRNRAPRAMLGLPIGRPGGVHGVLMLESTTFTHAFEPETVEALTVLSTQAIGAVENVRLTSDLSSLADDVAHLRAKAAALTSQAETDPLTGVANRAGLKAGFHAAMRAAAERHGDDDERDRQLGVLFIDLDDFKAVNDRRGHAIGDAVLSEIAARLSRIVRADDVVARVGGDEFVIVSVDVPTDELHAISDRALYEVSRPVDVPGVAKIGVSASIGVARVSLESLESLDDMDEVLKLADEAMYRAKNAGKNRVAHR